MAHQRCNLDQVICRFAELLNPDIEGPEDLRIIDVVSLEGSSSNSLNCL